MGTREMLRGKSHVGEVRRFHLRLPPLDAENRVPYVRRHQEETKNVKITINPRHPSIKFHEVPFHRPFWARNYEADMNTFYVRTGGEDAVFFQELPSGSTVRTTMFRHDELCTLVPGRVVVEF